MEDVTMRVHRHPPHDMLTDTLLGGFDNWDSEYYIYIAQHGYTFLQSMAFFPLYPWLMWLVGRVLLFPLNFVLADRSLFLLAGTLINCSVFPLAATALYLLTLLQTDNQRLSIVTVLLFCVNPASVFMSAVYTESLCLLHLHRALLTDVRTVLECQLNVCSGFRHSIQWHCTGWIYCLSSLAVPLPHYSHKKVKLAGSTFLNF